MSVYSPADEEDKNKRKTADGTALRQAPPASVGSSAQTTPVNDGSVNPATQSGGTGSGFVNFDQYYNANADAAKNTSDQLTAGAEKAAADAQTGLNNATDQFNTAVTAGTNSDSKNGVGVSSAVASALHPASTGLTLDTHPISIGDNGTDANGNHAFDPAHQSVNGNHAFDPAHPNAGPRALAQGQTSVYDATKLANGTYTGPGSLLDAQFGIQGVQDKMASANSQVRALQTNEGRQALLQNMGDNQPGSQLDSVLTGQAAGGKYAALAKQYGGLSQLLDKSVADSANTVEGAKTAGVNTAYKYKSALANYQVQKKAADDKAAATAAAADPDNSIKQWLKEHPEAAGKSENYDQYLKMRPEDYVRQAGKFLSPSSWIMEALDMPTSVDMATNFEEKNGGILGEGKIIGAGQGAVEGKGRTQNDSNRAYGAFQNAFSLTPQIGKKVYDSMSPAELSKLESLGVHSQDRWLKNRATQLGLSTY